MIKNTVVWLTLILFLSITFCFSSIAYSSENLQEENSEFSYSLPQDFDKSGTRSLKSGYR